MFPFTLLLTGSAAAGSIPLRRGAAAAVLDPATLRCQWQPAGKPMLELSTAQKEVAVVELKTEPDRAEWRLPDSGVRVEVVLDPETLSVRFTAVEPGVFTWPVIADAAIQAWVLPMHEGLYVPAEDAGWIRHLVESGPLDTTADLGLPFWGQSYPDMTASAILTNPFNNQLRFENRAGRLGLTLRHEFTSTQKRKEYGIVFRAGGLSPVEAARHYRNWLMERGEFVRMTEKCRTVPEAAKLAGAAHIYLWGQDPLAAGDVRDWPQLGRLLRNAALEKTDAAGEDSRAAAETAARGHCAKLLNAEVAALVARAALPGAEPLTRFDKSVLTGALNALMGNSEFPEFPDWAKLELPPEVRSLLEKPGTELSMPERTDRNTALLQAAFPGCFAERKDWGDGVCPRMVRDLEEAGFDRLWLGSDSWRGMVERPGTVSSAREHGFLIGPYDSYHSMHPPEMKDTWETAQLGAEIYSDGGILDASGKARKGFQQKGKLLSPMAARPLVEERIGGLLRKFSANSWFVDCDAFGQFFDDYTPARPAGQADDAAARRWRLAWIRDQGGGLVIGSEGCSAVMADTIHFAHGVMTPTLGWGDADMRDKGSPFFQGAYYPPNGPAIFFKPIPLKEDYRLWHFDPRFRLPLFQTVFHDSVVATHHWGSGSLKFRKETSTNALLEILYGVPPLWHLNRDEFAARRAQLLRHYAVFSPLHREIMALPMTDFLWLNPERTVQQTVFGGSTQVTANFSGIDFPIQNRSAPLPSRSVLILRNGKETLYQP